MKIKIKGNQNEEIEDLLADYPYAFHYVDLETTKIPWHWHEELEFDYILKGSVRVITPNASYVFHEKEGFFINTNVLAAMESVNGERPGCIESHLFHAVFLGGHFKSIFETKYLNPIMHNKKLEIMEFRSGDTEQEEMLKKVRQLSALQKKENTELQTRNLLSEMWLLVMQQMKNEENSGFPVKKVNQERIQTMMAFIQQNYKEKISLEDIALSASVSRRECLRCFQNCIHKTPYEYLQEYRIEEAKKLLRNTDIPVMDIAFQTGFTDGAYFGKVFKNACGKTPGSYRKNAREEL